MKQAKVITDAEFKRVLAVIKDGHHSARNRIAVMISHLAGLRVGEIACLKIEDVTLPDGSISEQVHLKSEYTKGGHSRTVFINAKLAKELANYVKTLSALSITLSKPDSPLIRSQKGGRAFSANALCQVFLNIYEAAGVKGGSSHSGRRGFISKLAHANVSSKVIMELAGHRHLTTTQRYIDVTDEHKRLAVEVL